MNNGNSDKTFYYGNSNYVDSYKNGGGIVSDKKKRINIIAILIFMLSLFGLYKMISFSYMALGISIFCFICSVCCLKNRDIFYYLAGFVSLISIVLFGLFYFGIINNDSASLRDLRKTQFVNDVKSAVNKVEEDYHISASNDPKCYSYSKINSLFKKKMDVSPLKAKYSANSYIKISGNLGSRQYVICFVDLDGNGFNNVSENTLTKDNLMIGNAGECFLPSYCK